MKRCFEGRTRELKIRLTARERRLIEEAAASAGLTMTEWILQTCFEHLPPRSASGSGP